MLSVALMLCYCRRPFTLGAAVAVGCFWRFSFVAYAFPLGVSFASDPRSIASGICGFALIAACLVAADSWYFGRLVATPYANFRFNANSDRLAAFGLHPWWTHMFLNMPLLFGHFPFFFFSRANGRLLILRASAAFAVLALSTSRHQEARFLLPAAAAVFATGIRRSALALWVVTNLCIGSFFAFVHQAGLVKLLLADHGKSATCLILVGTYVAPRSLLPPTVSAADFLQEDLDEFGQFLDADCCFQSKTLVRRLAVAASVPFRQLECALIARGARLSSYTVSMPTNLLLRFCRTAPRLILAALFRRVSPLDLCPASAPSLRYWLSAESYSCAMQCINYSMLPRFLTQSTRKHVTTGMSYAK